MEITMKNTIISVIGLFIPAFKDENGKYCYTIQVGVVPLGWIMIAVAVIVNLIM